MTGAAHPEEKKGGGKTFEDDELELTGGIFRELYRPLSRKGSVTICADTGRKGKTKGKIKAVYGYSKGRSSTCPNPYSQICEMCGARKYQGIQHKCKDYMQYLLGRKKPVVPRHKQANYEISYQHDIYHW